MSDENKPTLTKEQVIRIFKEARAHEIIDAAEAMSDEEVEKCIRESGVTEADRKESLARQRVRFEAARDNEQAAKKP
jgi:hypothetical protein